ncbi:MAG: hypothetical protein ACRD0R_20495 [Acidimicrobiales bacterium]|jgi:hypothetical protein
MSATPPGPPEGGPPPAGPWASDNLPPPPGAPAQQAEPPPSIVTAVRLMWLGAGLSALGILLTFFQTDALRDAIEDSDSSLTPSEVDSAVAVGVGFGVVVGLIGVGLWLWMASANGQGKSWARVVATVLGALNVVGAIFSLAVNPATAMSAVLTIVSLILAVVILVLLYRPESSRFYEARSRTW